MVKFLCEMKNIAEDKVYRVKRLIECSKDSVFLEDVGVSRVSFSGPDKNLVFKKAMYVLWNIDEDATFKVTRCLND